MEFSAWAQEEKIEYGDIPQFSDCPLRRVVKEGIQQSHTFMCKKMNGYPLTTHICGFRLARVFKSHLLLQRNLEKTNEKAKFYKEFIIFKHVNKLKSTVFVHEIEAISFRFFLILAFL